MDKIKKVASILLLVTGILSGLLLIERITRRGDSEYKYLPFFKEEQEFDVLFFGTSHVYNGIFPMQLWNDYGITSYNFGGHSNSLAASYWAFKNAIEYHKPKIAVLDVFLERAQTTSMPSHRAHLTFDAFPLSRTKIKGIRDIFEVPSDQIELIFPFTIYHNRWNEISYSSIKNALRSQEATKEKGAESRIGVAKPINMNLINKEECFEDKTVGQLYINRFIEDCKAEGIEVVLINLPYPASEEEQKSANSVYRVIDERWGGGVNYINMQYEDLVDFDTDCYDTSSHLNPSGARKVTNYLGSYLVDHYDLTDHRNETAYQSWNQDYKDYRQFLFNTIKKQTDLKVDLMLLNNSNYTAELLTVPYYQLDKIDYKLIRQLENGIIYNTCASIENNGISFDAKLTITDKLTGNTVDEKYYKNAFREIPDE